MIQNDLWRIFLVYLPPGNADPSAIDVQLNFVSSCCGNGCHLRSIGHGSQGTCTRDWRLGSCRVRQLWFCLIIHASQHDFGRFAKFARCFVPYLVYNLHISLLECGQKTPGSSVVMTLYRRSRFVIWSYWVGKCEWSSTPQNVLNARNLWLHMRCDP